MSKFNIWAQPCKCKNKVVQYRIVSYLFQPKLMQLFQVLQYSTADFPLKNSELPLPYNIKYVKQNLTTFFVKN